MEQKKKINVTTATVIGLLILIVGFSTFVLIVLNGGNKSNTGSTNQNKFENTVINMQTN